MSEEFWLLIILVIIALTIWHFKKRDGKGDRLYEHTESTLTPGGSTKPPPALDAELPPEATSLEEVPVPSSSNVLNLRPWFAREESVPEEMAKDFVRATAWWLTHSSGHPVRAPGHAKRVKLSPRHGWAIEYGANSFLIGRAIESCRKILQDELKAVPEGESIEKELIVKKLESAISRSVGNYYGDMYDHYPPDGGQLVFGAQAVDIDDGVRFIIKESGIDQFFND